MPSRRVPSLSLAPRRKLHAISVAPKRKSAVCRHDDESETEFYVSMESKKPSTMKEFGAGRVVITDDKMLKRMVQVYASGSRGRQIVRQTKLPCFRYSVEKVLTSTINLAKTKASLYHDLPNLFAKPMRRAGGRTTKRKHLSPERETVDLAVDLSKLAISHPSTLNMNSSIPSASRFDFNPFDSPIKFEGKPYLDDPILHGSFLSDMMMNEGRVREAAWVEGLQTSSAMNERRVSEAAWVEGLQTSSAPTTPRSVPSAFNSLSLPLGDLKPTPAYYRSIKACQSEPPKMIANDARRSVPPKFRFSSNQPVPKAGKWLVLGRSRDDVMYSVDREIIGFRLPFKKLTRRSPRNKRRNV